MASAVFSKASALVSSSALRRRLPLVGAICVLTLGFTNLSLSSHFKPRSIFGNRQSRSVRSIAMAASDKTVPSIVVYITVPNREAGKKLAQSIVKEKLAACVNIVPGMYRIHLSVARRDSEELLIIKTRESLLEALKEHVKANHEYEVPEVIALPITGGSVPYLEWLKNSTRD
ncbi:Divalent ion tolerance protein, CutA [Dillenia turbinata]|uniref:Divalent ion tolerance protein, CutA n=1 Tax=Dillenia turbinata TaxID=194707 RepID=A0AAN8VXV0_9MAGN